MLAVQLELISDLNIEAFLRALNRLFDRRSKNMVIYSGNATNFVDSTKGTIQFVTK